MFRNEAKKKQNKEIVEMAAEQFARLFWKQWLYMKEKEKRRSRRKSPSKSPSLWKIVIFSKTMIK